MAFTDFIIIYLAFGVPFSVRRLTQMRRTPVFDRYSTIAFVSLFWPFYAVSRILHLFFPTAADCAAFRHRQTDAVRVRVEDALVAQGQSMHVVFEFREVFGRYFGLLDAETALVESRSANCEISKVMNHPSPRIAAKCRDRRNLRLLRKHGEQAESELLEFLDRATSEEDFAILIRPIGGLLRQYHGLPHLLQSRLIKLATSKSDTPRALEPKTSAAIQ